MLQMIDQGWHDDANPESKLATKTETKVRAGTCSPDPCLPVSRSRDNDLNKLAFSPFCVSLSFSGH
jgi:hypothetical protein